MSENPYVTVLSPDEQPGLDFTETLSKQGIKAKFKKVNWPDRVLVENGENIENPDKEALSDAISESLFETLTNGNPEGKITISCNTASASDLIEMAKKKVEERGLLLEPSRLITTLDALSAKYKNDQNKPLFLGTTVLSGKLSTDENFNTPEDEDNLKLIQEIIWRTKVLQGSVVNTANSNYTDLSSQSV